MTNPQLAHQTQAAELQSLLGTKLPAIGVSFTSEVPAGVAILGNSQPASCSYWKLAAEGAVFSTAAAQHQGCPIGAHTHGVAAAPEKSADLMSMVGTMVQLGYIRMEEVPQIPHRAPGSFQHAVYGPLSALPLAPELVLVRGTASQLMLVAEAAQMAGLTAALPTMGRPTCAALPLASQSGKLAMSLGCVGNRVYTGMPDDEAYVAIPGASLAPLVQWLSGVVKANGELFKFHQGRVSA
jgi:uncharacterized protein (DUF169 family)